MIAAKRAPFDAAELERLVRLPVAEVAAGERVPDVLDAAPRPLARHEGGAVRVAGQVSGEVAAVPCIRGLLQFEHYRVLIAAVERSGGDVGTVGEHDAVPDRWIGTIAGEQGKCKKPAETTGHGSHGSGHRGALEVQGKA